MNRKTRFIPLRASLADLVGTEAVEATAAAFARVSGSKENDLRRLARRKIDFFPAAMQKRLLDNLSLTGSRVSRPLTHSAPGASTRGFEAVTNTGRSPLCGYGFHRVGEDGRLYFIAKSEHYHAPLGHAFPGYELLRNAQHIGIGNATHNNTRGFITRRLEMELVRHAHRSDPGDEARLPRILKSGSGTVLNRVLNLETGSLAAEAAIKMMLARFFLVQEGCAEPRFKGLTPVFLVMGDDQGGVKANYHGTTVLAQAMRGMWPGLRHALDQGHLIKVVPIRANDMEGLESAFATYSRGRYRIAGFLHEIVMMNYGAVLLSRRFLRRAYALCRSLDVPVLVDEIQTGIWSPELFMYREYGLTPSFVALGKGFPGGEYPASRLLFSARYDVLPQFGALVTNGQEELASLAYLVTLAWARSNSAVTAAVGEYYGERLLELARLHPAAIDRIEGRRHMHGVYFRSMDIASRVVQALNDGGLDVSIQSYKADCPPCMLTKLPLIAGYEAVDMVIGKLRAALEHESPLILG